MTTPPPPSSPSEPPSSGALPLQDVSAPVPSAASLAALLDRLASPERLDGLRDAKGRSLIMAAIEEDDPEMVAFLAPRSDLLETIKADSIDEEPYYTPLMLAAKLGRVACAKELLKHQPEQQCTVHTWSPLNLAVHEGHLDCVTLLAPWSRHAHHVRVEFHPLVQAAKKGRLDLMTALLPHLPASLADRRQVLRSALLRAVSVTEHSPQRNACVQALLHQPGMEILPQEADTPENPTHEMLFNAIVHHQSAVVRMLLPMFNTNALRNNPSNGKHRLQTALHVAIEARDVDSVALVLPLSKPALAERQSYQARSEYYTARYHNTTPAEFALAQLNDCDNPLDWRASVTIADEVLACCVHQHRPIPQPSFAHWSSQRPMTDVEKREHWPRLCSALERQDLERTLTDEDVTSSRSTPPRPRL